MQMGLLSKKRHGSKRLPSSRISEQSRRLDSVDTSGIVSSNSSMYGEPVNGGSGKPTTAPSSISSHNGEIEDLRNRLTELMAGERTKPSGLERLPSRGTQSMTAPYAGSSSLSSPVAKFLQKHDVSTQPSSIARCKIVIGIDFGTTFSGVAYAVVHPNDNAEEVRINTVCDWEGRLPGRTTSNKVPTEIAFDESDGGKPYWGFDIPDHLSEEKIKYVKLLLEPDVSRRVSSMNDIVNPEGTKVLLNRQGRSAVKVAGLFIKLLWEHAKAQIIRHKGLATYNYAEKVVLFTVPAVWSERAKHNTYMVAVEAGLAADDISLHMVSEPEAAAVAVLKDRAAAGRLIDGDIFVVVDAGGGTVDLTSYRIVSVEPLKLEEAVAGDGDVCGATFLELRFHELLLSRVGKAQLTKLNPLIKERMICDWEDSIRATFTGVDDRKYHLITPGIPDNKTNGIESGLMRLTAAHLLPIFSPTIERIQQLVQKQLISLAQQNLRPSAIVLVGGLGSNRYLAKQLKQQYQSNEPELASSIEIQQPDIAWESVAHGAVRCDVLGYGSIFSMRIARWNIGYSVMKPWNEGKGFHPEQKYYCEYDGKYWANNCVTWLLRRGQKLEQNVLFEDTCWFADYWESEIEEALRSREKVVWNTWSFIASQEDNASDNASEHTRKFMSFSVKLDFGRFSPDLMEKEFSPDGRPYRTARWQLCARQSMSGMKISLGVFDEIVEDDVKIDFCSLSDRVDEGEAYTIRSR